MSSQSFCLLFSAFGCSVSVTLLLSPRLLLMFLHLLSLLLPFIMLKFGSVEIFLVDRPVPLKSPHPVHWSSLRCTEVASGRCYQISLFLSSIAAHVLHPYWTPTSSRASILEELKIRKMKKLERKPRSHSLHSHNLPVVGFWEKPATTLLVKEFWEELRLANIAIIACASTLHFFRTTPPKILEFTTSTLESLYSLHSCCEIGIPAVEQKLWLEIELVIMKVIHFQWYHRCIDSRSGCGQK